MNRINWMQRFPIYLLSKGGLGNQLFVYAYAHEISISTNRRVIISTYWHKSNLDRSFQLEEFSGLCKHQITFAHSRLAYAILFIISKLHGRAGKLLNILFAMCGIYREPNLPTNKSSMAKSMFIEGYFQDRLLYQQIQHFVLEIQEYVNKFKLEVPEKFSAGHFRRGDYTAETKNFGLLDRQYYEDLLNESGQIIICTDDYDLASKYWKNNSNLDVYGPDRISPWEVIAVLSKSSKLYIANSSLSWWAGMLQIQNGGITYIPQPWFRSFKQDDSRMRSQGMIMKPAIWSED